MDEKAMFKKIATGFEWVGDNYDALSESSKAALDEFVQGTTELLYEYGRAKGTNYRIAAFVVCGIVVAPVAYGVGAIYGNWKERRKNRLNKTETTDSK